MTTTRDPEEVLPTRGRGLSGSFADRVAGDPPGQRTHTFQDDDGAEPAAPAPRPPRRSRHPRRRATRSRRRRQPCAASRPRPGVAPRPTRTSPIGSSPASPVAEPGIGERDPGRAAAFAGSDERTAGASERRPSRRRDPAAPEWEAAPPAEAYPTLRARRLPELSVPPLLVAVLAARPRRGRPVRAAGPAGLRRSLGGRDADATRQRTRRRRW